MFTGNSLAASLTWPTRLRLLGGRVAVAVFIMTYARLVCPFVCRIDLWELFRNVLLLSLLQGVLFAFLLRCVPLRTAQGERSPARMAYLLSVAAWLVTGVLAVAANAFLYPEFPSGAHLRYAVGYCILGAGIVAQLEYLLFERIFPAASAGERLRERVGWRLIEGYFIFTTAPVLVLLLSLSRALQDGTAGTHLLVEAVMQAMFFVGAALVAAIAYGRSLQRDAASLLAAVHRVGRGDFTPAASTGRPDELGAVASGINDMAEGLQMRERIRDAFGRFVSREVADEFIAKFASTGREAELGGTRRDVAVLFADLRNFTPLAESLPPEELVKVINGYFSEMVAAVQENGGVVDKFIGDAVLAVFGLTSDAGEEVSVRNAVLAVRAAEEMQRRLEIYNRGLASRGLQLVSGVGVHCGEVVAGYIGSVDRLEFTVLGHAVNVAARLEGHAKPPLPSVIFSSEVARRVEGVIAVREVASVGLKGVAGEMKLFSTAALIATMQHGTVAP